METEGIFKYLGGRKFTYALLAFGAACGFFSYGKIDAKLWMELVSLIGATYVIGNVASDVANKK